jgi:hypothetical protein
LVLDFQAQYPAPHPLNEAPGPESQFPAATIALELFFGLHFGCSTSAVWTLHGANLSHDLLPSRISS